MLVTQQPVLRRFWYPIIPVDHLTDGPKPFSLLGEDIVLWRAGDGRIAAMRDRCCHRTARLSKGWVEGDLIVCGYHGWSYDADGACARIPQIDDPAEMIEARVETFRSAERYGYAWVCLDEPLQEMPDIPEAEDADYRLIQQFYEIWRCAGLRVMENSFDNAHFSFVHRKSFGDHGDPIPANLTIDEFDGGFVMRSDVPVINPEAQKELLQMDSDRTVRHMTATWWMPFARKLHIRYPNGLIHCIVTIATPIDDERSQICQFAIRNDTEDDAPAEKIIEFDRQVTTEDRDILESTDHDVMLELTSGREDHMPSDRPGIVMRKMLRALLASHGETEAVRGPSTGALAAE